MNLEQLKRRAVANPRTMPAIAVVAVVVAGLCLMYAVSAKANQTRLTTELETRNADLEAERRKVSEAATLAKQLQTRLDGMTSLKTSCERNSSELATNIDAFAKQAAACAVPHPSETSP